MKTCGASSSLTAFGQASLSEPGFSGDRPLGDRGEVFDRSGEFGRPGELVSLRPFGDLGERLGDLAARPGEPEPVPPSGDARGDFDAHRDFGITTSASLNGGKYGSGSARLVKRPPSGAPTSSTQFFDGFLELGDLDLFGDLGSFGDRGEKSSSSAVERKRRRPAELVIRLA